jgi:hypothetical protein
VEITVVEHAAAGSYLEGALLLLVGALGILLVLHNLEHEETDGDGAGPEEKEEADDPETRARERDDAGRVVAGATGSRGCLHGKTWLSALSLQLFVSGRDHFRFSRIKELRGLAQESQCTHFKADG